jgi:hypothetical protein
MPHGDWDVMGMLDDHDIPPKGDEWDGILSLGLPLRLVRRWGEPPQEKLVSFGYDIMNPESTCSHGHRKTG